MVVDLYEIYFFPKYIFADIVQLFLYFRFRIDVNASSLVVNGF